jgi:hypothetical protein
MKSDRQAERMALSCFVLGRFAVTDGWGAAGAGDGAATAAGGGGVATTGAGTGGVGAAVGLALTAVRQAGDSCAALARKHKRSSGLLGSIHEQCDVKSSSVQAARMALS